MRNTQRISQIRADETTERRAARLEDTRLRARQTRFVASDLFRNQQNERDRLKYVNEKHLINGKHDSEVRTQVITSV